MKINHTQIEKKWQEKWRKELEYKSIAGGKGRKMYVLDMFPYPSGATMHVGHLEGYVGTDILSRYFRMRGLNVLHPMGWDAFGLPAENYAIRTGIDPNISTHENIKTFKRQLESCGLSYDWEREIDTSSPEFYRWTQWIFIKLFEKGMAYKKKAPVNWCPKDETVLANEQVIDGKCERCDTPVVHKELDQWFFKITHYADRLVSGLDKVDWLPEVKRQQINWIGRSEGLVLEFKIDGKNEPIEVFTTRPDTLESATFIAVASKDKSALQNEEKTGKLTGEYALNPLTGEKIQIWETNYVASDYGTGAIMGVPAYDVRDREFAEKYGIDVVVKPLNKKIGNTAVREGWGKKKVNYHLRDWLISRQRYWGCPIPMVHCDGCGWQPVPESELPVLLPSDVDFRPHGESPIARSKTFQKGVKCPKCGKEARREVDTMDTYVDSSWYFIRFADPANDKEFASVKAMKDWLPVDIYVGGGHVVQHLLFARFFWKFLFDEGYIDKSLGDEPFLKLRAPGWILGEDSRKMSKRWGNVVTPDDILPKFGADTLRIYEMFMGPFDVIKPWSMSGVEGAHRFLNKIWKLFEVPFRKIGNNDINIKMHQTIKIVSADIEKMKFNTAISAIMVYANSIKKFGGVRDNMKVLIKLLAPFAPHMSEEIWSEILKEKDSIHLSSWPKYDPKLLEENRALIVIQVNGKVRGQIAVDKSISDDKEKIMELAKKEERVSKYLRSGKLRREIFVSGRLVNFVV